jgi:dienelactone hydrolase
MSPRWKTGLVALALGAGVIWMAQPYAASLAMILDLTGRGGMLRIALPVRLHDVTTRDLEIPTRAGAIPARLYVPHGGRARTVIVFPGIHTGGVDEPRLAALSRRLAASGMTVLSVPIPDLRAYRIIPRATDTVEDVAVWATAQTDVAPLGRVGVIGVSFAGGLALVAAGRPALAGKIELVVSLGGHGDLPRALTYLCTGRLPDGTTRPPHDYGVAVLLFAGLHHFAPPAQIAPLRHALLAFLDASGYESTDRDRSVRLFAEARAEGAALPEPARTVMSWVNARDVAVLGPKLLPYLEELAGAAALSPERSPATQAPVFLLHGATDNVIPSSETPRLAAFLEARGNAHVQWLLTPLLSHADIGGAITARDAWDLIRFWKAMLTRLE